MFWKNWEKIFQWTRYAKAHESARLKSWTREERQYDWNMLSKSKSVKCADNSFSQNSKPTYCAASYLQTNFGPSSCADGTSHEPENKNSQYDALPK